MEAPTNDTKLELLCDHYKDSFANIQSTLKVRGRLFALLLAVVMLMMLQMHSPQQTAGAVSELIAAQLGITGSLDFSFVPSVVWFLLLAIVVRYCQVVVHIDREYTYLHALEEQLNAQFGGSLFTREGKSYLQAYPALSKWTHFVYTGLFPIVLTAVAVAKILSEWNGWSKLFVFNVAICLFLLVTVLLYLLALRGWVRGTVIVVLGVIVGIVAVIA